MHGAGGTADHTAQRSSACQSIREKQDATDGAADVHASSPHTLASRRLHVTAFDPIEQDTSLNAAAIRPPLPLAIHTRCLAQHAALPAHAPGKYSSDTVGCPYVW